MRLAGLGKNRVLSWREPAARAVFRALPVDVLSHVNTPDPVFALTFDDGPHPATTAPLLDVLARHRATATFFLIGERIRGNESIVAWIVAAGHEIANHLMRDEPSVRLSEDTFREELARVSALLRPYGPVRWFRPGSGWLTPRMVRSAADQGLRAVLGTLVAANHDRPADRRIAPSLAAAVRPGSIVVLHEGTDQRRGVAATTDQLLALTRVRGLTAVTVAELGQLRNGPAGPQP